MGALQSFPTQGRGICAVHEHDQSPHRIELEPTSMSDQQRSAGRSSSSRRSSSQCPQPSKRSDSKHRKRHGSVWPEKASTATSSSDQTAGPHTPTSRCSQKQEQKDAVSITTPSFHMPEFASLPVEAIERPSEDSLCCSLTSRSSIASRERSRTGRTRGSLGEPSRDAPRPTLRRQGTPHFATDLDRDLELWLEADMLDDSSPQMRSPRRVLQRRPTPYYVTEYLDSDPEVGVEADKPSMVFLQKHVVRAR